MRAPALAFAFLLAASASAQEVYDTADPMPALKGGLQALQDAVTYPVGAREAGIAGRVLVAFVVDAEGRVAEAAVLRSAHPLLDDAALAAVYRAPFEPGRLQGAPVAVRMVLPVVFTLDGTEDLGQDDGDATGNGADGRVDKMPEIVGGLGAVVNRVVYPPEAEAAGIGGRVLVSFVVSEAGAVEAAEVVEPVHPLLDAAALAAVRATPFRPGLRDGQPVRVQMVLPITFTFPQRD